MKPGLKVRNSGHSKRQILLRDKKRGVNTNVSCEMCINKTLKTSILIGFQDPRFIYLNLYSSYSSIQGIHTSFL